MLPNLGVTLDSSLSFNQHVMNTSRSAFLEPRRIGLIHMYLTVDAAKTIVCSLVLSMLDWNGVPGEVERIEDMFAFMRKLKTYLVHQQD